MIAKIALPIEPNDGTMGYYYEIPSQLLDKISLGQRVVVPFGRNEVVGYVFSIEKNKILPYPLKPIYTLVDETVYLSESYFQFALLVAKYYFANPYNVFELMFPKYKKFKRQLSYQISESKVLPKGLENMERRSYLKEELPFTEKEIEAYLKQGVLEKKLKFLPFGRQKEETVYLQKASIVVDKKLNEKQRKILTLFEDKDLFTKKEIEKKLGNVSSSLNTLVKKGYLVKTKQIIRRRPLLSEAFLTYREVELNEAQSKVYRTILAGLNSYHTYLLHGITGSGKTEVYIKLIQNVLAKGKTALVLVPEIALTPQLFARFYSVFGEAIGLWHSALSDGEKFDEWLSLTSGQTKVLIGVRSAIFAPIQNLGIIIIDEAHDASYKQSEPEPRYHTIQVAQLLARQEKIPLVFGSATPSIEMMWQANQGRYTYLSLPARAKTSLPAEITLCDMKAESVHGEGYFISELLLNKLSERLEKNEQSILYLNRRGFSTYVYCLECGKALICPHCQSHLTYHKTSHRLKCHYCDEDFPVLLNCPECQSRSLQYKGYGTEQVEAYLKSVFPKANICRLDYETTREKNAHQTLLARFQKGECDILIGTQMIAKGLDNANVTLVGVINADIGFNLLDYKAKERLFQQLVQVSGRAGRGKKKGEVIIQTYQPEAKLFAQVKAEDYEAFYADELKERALYDYPPYVDLLRIVVSDTDEGYLKEVLRLISHEISSLNEGLTVYGPAPCPIATLRGRYRYQFLLKGNERELYHLGWQLRHKYKHSKKSKTYRFMLDLAPETII